MSTEPLVTVIVTTRNNHDTLELCLYSIQRQSYARVELLVVDNNSTDDTKDIARKYTDHVFNYGPERSAQRNFGAQQARGEYVLIIDSDMELSEHVVAACVEKAQAEPNVKAILIPEESFGKGFWAQCKRLERSYYVGIDAIEAARFFDKNLYRELGGYNEHMSGGEDWDLTRRIRKIAEVSRVSAFIAHNEGHPRFFRTVRKMYYYGHAASVFFANNPTTTALTDQSGPIERYKLFFSHPVKLFKNPILGIGMLMLKTAEYAGGALGMIQAKRKHTHHESEMAKQRGSITPETHTATPHVSKFDVSIITPAYNAAGTIGKLLDALASQTYDHHKFELILIDDGSTDATKEIIKKYIADSDIALKLIEENHAGPGQARNRGITLASGTIIAFTDADCIPDKNWVEQIVDEVLVQKHDVVSGFTYCREPIIYPWKISPAGQRGITANLAIKRTGLQSTKFRKKFNGLYGEDTDLLLRLATRSPQLQAWPSDKMRVEHPVNSIGLRAVIGRARARLNEVLLLKLYGPRVFSSMHPLYQPVILNRFSMLATAFVMSMGATVVLLKLKQPLLLLVAGAAIALLFIIRGYKVLIRSESYAPIVLTDRVKTLIYFLVYNAVYLATRIEGSIRYRKIVL